MSQIRLRDYHEPLTSFFHNLINLIIHGPGRFGGYDTLVKTNTLKFKITHGGTNFTYKDEVGDTHGPIGVAMTTQGLIIVEDGDLLDNQNNPLIFTIDTNDGNAYDRVDIIVCSHQFVNIDGGQPASYAIIKGPVNDPNSTEPALVDPYFQFIIGRIYIPAGATDINQCKYEPALCPDSGDGPDARIRTINRFESMQQQATSTTVYTTAELILLGMSGWSLAPDGNTFAIRPATAQLMDGIRFGVNRPVQDGAEINMLITQFVTIRDQIDIQQPDLVKGYSGIVLGQFTNTTSVFGGVTVNALNPSINETWLVKLIKVQNQWWVTQVIGSSFGSGFKRGMSICLQLTISEINQLFETAGANMGLGKSGWAIGWAIENGLNNTTDKTARFVIGSNEVPGGNTDPLVTDDFIYHMGSLDGSPKIFLETGQLPRIVPKLRFSTDQGGNRFGSTWLKYDGNSHEVDGDAIGNDESHENRPPWAVSCWIVKL